VAKTCLIVTCSTISVVKIDQTQIWFGGKRLLKVDFPTLNGLILKLQDATDRSIAF